ncbi:hypothetical protein EC988_003770 [Linderina pennispora]|nr:hypothetical protein EC988_003770 [Linderina pennispora]
MSAAQPHTLEPKFEVLSVLEGELENLRPNAKVYVQKTSTPIYFLAERSDVLDKTKKQLDKLKGKRGSSNLHNS